ncbi:MAG: D-alanine--D-alanine ligase [Oscillospiraceae bacterium]|nr:D-alanine--D-alanine ligase [Oscillospiraceae bacterium]
MKITIGLFFGGKSTEHEVSIITGLQAFAALDRVKYDCVPIYISKQNEFYIGDSVGKIEDYADIPALLKRSRKVAILNLDNRVGLYEITPKKIDVRKPAAFLDVALPCVHGTNVEDGVLQGFFETLRLPYAGCDVVSSAVGMDKFAQKSILKQAGISVLDCVAFTSKEYMNNRESLLAEIDGQSEFPVIVKPNNLGSSIGIKIAADKSELADAIEHALLFADCVLVEPAIVNLKEVNCAVLGDKDSAEPSECEEPVSSGGILDFNDKYTNGNKSGKNDGMASLKRKIPADISESQREEIRATAVKAFRALGCAGVARIDFLIDTQSGGIYFNEINTIPGSLSFYLWDAVGVKYPELLDRLVSLALKREREKANLNFSFDSSILSGFQKGMKSAKT